MNLNKYQKLTLGLVIAALVAVGAVLAYQNKNRNTSSINNDTISTFEECRLAGFPIMESYPAQCLTPDGRNLSQDIGNEMEKQELIKIEYPRPNQEISSPFEFRGQARGSWYFEASFLARLLDAAGNELAVIPVQAQGEWMTTEFVPFKATMNFITPTTSTGMLILEKDNPSGLPQNDDRLIIPIRFAQGSGDKIIVKAFFGNSNQNAECENVVAVNREIQKTVATGRAAIEELLKGLTKNEQNQGYITTINPKTQLNSLTINNGVANVDFSQELDQGVAGSCRVNAIRAQITETLTQFPTVRQVVISINGKSDDILQP